MDDANTSSALSEVVATASTTFVVVAVILEEPLTVADDDLAPDLILSRDVKIVLLLLVLSFVDPSGEPVSIRSLVSES